MISNPQLMSVIESIRDAMPGRGLDEAADRVKKRLSGLGVDDVEELVLLARNRIESELEISTLKKHSIFEISRDWYHGPTDRSSYWPLLKRYLLEEKKWKKQDVRQIDLSSNEIVSLLADPREKQFSTRGLVLGHVQSGKTANMTAVIAKAADEGYKMVIVLAGLTNKLRFQTQTRLTKDLVTNNQNLWRVETSDEVEGDYRAPAHGGILPEDKRVLLAVLKKNVSPLRQLQVAINRTTKQNLRRLRVLLIDDECDEASVNSARGEFDITAINLHIRQILSVIPAVSYVGYTATPFANVLVNPYVTDGVLDDLYPKNFITSLVRPDSYFGTERLFGMPPVDPEYPTPEEEGLDMIRSIPIDEVPMLQPERMRDRENFYPEMAPTLKSAVLYFILACAARLFRGHHDQHMTMLVHTSAFVVLHERVSAIIRQWVEANRYSILNKSGQVRSEMRSIWEDEVVRLPNNISKKEPVSFDELEGFLPEVIDRLSFVIENGGSDDRIDYENSTKTYIVVGGSILARGLTLEGLMVSYFLRSTSQYDTLMQMGRWFGYRPDYEDLPRMWMPDSLQMQFRALAGVEAEIREEIEQYAIQKKTPMELAVRIRAIPGMAITAATKMRSASDVEIGLWGAHRQTIRFEHTNSHALESNWVAGTTLLNEIDGGGYRDEESNKYLWRGVPLAIVLNFLGAYRIQESHRDLMQDILLDFLNTDDSRLRYWNIGLVTPRKGVPSTEELGDRVGCVPMINRAKLKSSLPMVADIKALMSKRDILFDCPSDSIAAGDWDSFKKVRKQKVGDKPLLLLYVINKDSSSNSESREKLSASRDILAIAVVFPGEKMESSRFVSVRINPYSADELEEIETEERAQVEAAGVDVNDAY